MIRVDRGAALAWRLRRHLLAPGGTSGAAAVVDALVAVPAHLDRTATELTVRLRSSAVAPGDLDRAVDDGTLVRTYAFRGSVHLMTPASASAHLGLRASLRLWERPAWRRDLGLEPEDWPALREAVREALADGPRTRGELGAAVAGHPGLGRVGRVLADPTSMVLKPLAWQGVLSLGPWRRGEPTFQRLETNALWPGLTEPAEAGPRAVEAYVRAYGPASTANLTSWLVEGLGVRRADLQRWKEELGDRLATVDVAGEERLVHREDLDELAAARTAPSVHLLPGLDPWVLGPGTADAAVVAPAIRPQVSRGAGLVLVGGAVVGTWSTTRGAVDVSWATGVRPVDGHALEPELARLAALLGRPLARDG